MNAVSVTFAQQLKAEQRKARHRKVWLMPVCILGILFLWTGWAFGKLSADALTQGYSALFYQLSMLNCIMLPVTLSVVASRLCDMEIKGNTLKLLCTVQKRGNFYDCKLLFGMKYIVLYVFGQSLSIVLFGRLLHFTEELPAVGMLLHMLATFTVSTVILIIQQTLSLLSDNQIMPLVVGLASSFLGLFSMYFPPTLSRWILWGYYGKFQTVSMSWDSATRITTYLPVPFPLKTYLAFLALGAVLYAVGKTLFLKKEV